MKKGLKSGLLWTFSIAFTLFVAVWQRSTGPSYPVKSTIEINDKEITNRLITTYDGEGDAEIRLKIPDAGYSGTMKYRRYKSYDEWTEIKLVRDGDYLLGYLPHQPPAGKVDYQVFIMKNDQKTSLTEEPVRIRFKGAVPLWILISHILIIFLAMVFANRTGVEVIFKGPRVYPYTVATIILLLVGGLILGPVIQKYAFGAYWTGWPNGNDLTDNKTVVAMIFWIIAFFRLRKNRKLTTWALIASIVLLIVYLIPHSVLGSELDYTAQ